MSFSGDVKSIRKAIWLSYPVKIESKTVSSSCVVKSGSKDVFLIFQLDTSL